MQIKSDKAARLLFQLPSGSRIYRKLQPANTWGWQEVLQNQMVYLLNVIAWQSTKDAARKIPLNAPKPFVPEFMRNLQAEQQMNKDIEAHDVDDIKAILAKKRV